MVPRLFFQKNWMFFGALLIFSSLMLHMILTHHSHPKSMEGEGNQPVHGADKKWLIALAAIIVVSHISSFLKKIIDYLRSGAQSVLALKRIKSESLEQYSYLFLEMRAGILHPKIH
jgi:hypothetical protein